MFESIKAAGAVAKLMKNKEALTEAATRVGVAMSQRRVSVDGPGGSVKVIMTGKLQVAEIRIDAARLAAAGGDGVEKDKLERLIVGAVNAAMKRVQQIATEEINKETTALGLPNVPGLDQLLGP